MISPPADTCQAASVRQVPGRVCTDDYNLDQHMKDEVVRRWTPWGCRSSWPAGRRWRRARCSPTRCPTSRWLPPRPVDAVSPHATSHQDQGQWCWCVTWLRDAGAWSRDSTSRRTRRRRPTTPPTTAPSQSTHTHNSCCDECNSEATGSAYRAAANTWHAAQFNATYTAITSPPQCSACDGRGDSRPVCRRWRARGVVWGCRLVACGSGSTSVGWRVPSAAGSARPASRDRPPAPTRTAPGLMLPAARRPRCWSEHCTPSLDTHTHTQRLVRDIHPCNIYLDSFNTILPAIMSQA